MYFLSKALAEKAAWDFAAAKGLDLITVIPTLVVGPFISSGMPPSLVTALALLTGWLVLSFSQGSISLSLSLSNQTHTALRMAGNKAHYSILKQIQFVHLDDLCNSLIFLFDHPEASGRYISSSHDTTIFELAELMRARYPEYDIPTEYVHPCLDSDRI